MAKYRPFLCSFWTDPDIEPMSTEEKLVYIFLFTNQLTTESGIYSISLKYISERTSININKINGIINTLQSVYNKITYDNNSSIIFVHGFMKRNYRGNTNLLDKSIIQDFHNNKSMVCWSKFVEIYEIHCISIKIKELLKTCGDFHKTSMSMSMKDEYENDTSSLKSEEKLSSLPEAVVIPDHLKEVWPAFIEVRKAKKAANTPRALKMLMNQLNKLSSKPEEQTEIVEQSIRSSWSDVYPLKKNTFQTSENPYRRI